MSISEFGVASVAAITVICYLFGMAVKVTSIEDKYIPLVCGVAGAILGVLCLRLGVPSFPAEDYITALAVGIVSGLAATGVNQLYWQLKGE